MHVLSGNQHVAGMSAWQNRLEVYAYLKYKYKYVHNRNGNTSNYSFCNLRFDLLWFM